MAYCSRSSPPRSAGHCKPLWSSGTPHYEAIADEKTRLNDLALGCILWPLRGGSWDMDMLLVIAIALLKEPSDLGQVQQGVHLYSLVARMGLPTAKLEQEWVWSTDREAMFIELD